MATLLASRAKAAPAGRAEPQAPVLVMGDSLAVGVGQALERLLPGQVATEAEVGERIPVTSSRLADRLARHPEARSVALSTGLNSGDLPPAEAARQILDIISRIRATGREVIIIGPTPCGSWDRGRLLGFADQLRATLARMYGFIDTWDLVGNPDRPGYFAEGASRDGLHPTGSGYRQIAEEIVNLIGEGT